MNDFLRVPAILLHNGMILFIMLEVQAFFYRLGNYTSVA